LRIFSPLLVARIELAALPLAKTAASPAGTCDGVRPRFFQPSISPASMRAGQRLSSMLSACRSCFSSRTWSSDVEHGEDSI